MNQQHLSSLEHLPQNCLGSLLKTEEIMHRITLLEQSQASFAAVSAAVPVEQAEGEGFGMDIEKEAAQTEALLEQPEQTRRGRWAAGKSMYDFSDSGECSEAEAEEEENGGKDGRRKAEGAEYPFTQDFPEAGGDFQCAHGSLEPDELGQEGLLYAEPALPCTSICTSEEAEASVTGTQEGECAVDACDLQLKRLSMSLVRAQPQAVAAEEGEGVEDTAVDDDDDEDEDISSCIEGFSSNTLNLTTGSISINSSSSSTSMSSSSSSALRATTASGYALPSRDAPLQLQLRQQPLLRPRRKPATATCPSPDHGANSSTSSSSCGSSGGGTGRDITAEAEFRYPGHSALGAWLAGKQFACVCCTEHTRAKVIQDLFHGMSTGVVGLADTTTGTGAGAGTGTGTGTDGSPLGGLLIVCHRAALESWALLARQCPNLRLLCYTESLAERRRRGARGPRLLGLTCHDVVITTFDILKAEEVHGMPALPRPLPPKQLAAAATREGGGGEKRGGRAGDSAGYSAGQEDERSRSWCGGGGGGVAVTETETDSEAEAHTDAFANHALLTHAPVTAAAQSYLHCLRWHGVLYDHDTNTTVKPTNAKGRAAMRLCGLRAASVWTHVHNAQQQGADPGIEYAGKTLKALASCMSASARCCMADLVYDARK